MLQESLDPMEGFEPAEIRLGPQIFLATFGGIRIVRVGTRNCFGNLLVHEKHPYRQVASEWKVL